MGLLSDVLVHEAATNVINAVEDTVNLLLADITETLVRCLEETCFNSIENLYTVVLDEFLMEDNVGQSDALSKHAHHCDIQALLILLAVVNHFSFGQ